MKRNALASLALAFATAFALADNLGDTTRVGALKRPTDYVYTADQADAVFDTRVPTTRTVNGHSLSNNVTITAADIGVEDGANNYTHPTYTARTGKPTADQAPGFGETFVVSQITSDGTGHVTGATDRTITIPSAVATTTTAGLMSAADKTIVNNAIGVVKIHNASNTSGDPITEYTPLTASDYIVGGVVLGKQVTIPNAVATGTGQTDGLMTAADKAKLDGIAAGANAYTHPTYTARTGKPTANATPGFGGAFTVSQITSDGTGHVTGATDRTITIPSAVATTTTAGLMSASDKTALDSLSSGGVTKAAVAAALQAQGITSADNLDDMDALAAQIAKIVAVLEALD